MKLSRYRLNIIILHYHVVGIHALALTIPFIIPFWRENGLNLFEVHLLQGLFALMILLLEVPSGYVADILGRKQTLVLAAFSEVVAIGAYCMGQSFGDFLIAEAFFAISMSLISGAREALLFESLRALKVSHKYKAILGRISLVGFGFAAVGMIFGGFLGIDNHRLPFYVALILTLPLIPLTILLKEPVRKKIEAKSNYAQEFKNIVNYCFVKKTDLAWILVYSGVIGAFTQAAFWSYQPFMEQGGIAEDYYGLAFALMNIVAAVSSALAHKVDRKFNELTLFLLLGFLLTTSYVLLGFVGLIVLPIIFQQIIRGFGHVVFSDAINKHADERFRATTLSLGSFIHRAVYTLVVIVFGICVEFDLRYAYCSAAVVITCFCLFMFRRCILSKVLGQKRF